MNKLRSRSDENALREALEMIKSLWLHRKGNEAPAAVQDTIQALWNKSDLKPLIVKQTKRENGWFLTMHMPPGVSYSEFKKREHYFSDAIGGAVHISKRGKAVYMEIMTKELESCYPYKLWDPAPHEKMYLPLPIGVTPRGQVTVDLVELPHVFVAGETNYGKSNLLHVFANTLLLHREVYLVVLDFKLNEFGYLDDYALLVNDIPTARIVLQLLNIELDKRLRAQRQMKVRKIQKYLEKGGKMPFIVLMVDELAEMNDKDCQNGLERLARLGRSIGINIIAATQRPSSTLYEKFGDIKALFPCRVCFIVADKINSNMILDSDRAAELPAIKGRAVYKWGLDMLETQTYFIDPDDEAPALLSAKFEGRGKVVSVIDNIKMLEAPRRLPPR